ncbi:hypothetical protein [Paenibacillus apis]|uniref:Uncharacterized protein n=1 Tax=Paenibacillus apis TaxID=1792174 RepID=A0A920CJ30_9BACL|nr:hypothetical protein [Paenibacillus apis]GIO41185.1 hypothetical protein J41TS4_09430 [Paenibacillus apis]
MKKTVKMMAAATLVFSTVFVSSAFAANATFKGSLPAKQGDTEISTVARANDSDVVKYFSIKITDIGAGYSSVRAFTERTNGANLSDPYTEVAADGAWHTVNYTTVPSSGTNVVLNLDNPVYVSTSVPVEGEWSPN